MLDFGKIKRWTDWNNIAALCIFNKIVLLISPCVGTCPGRANLRDTKAITRASPTYYFVIRDNKIV